MKSALTLLSHVWTHNGTDAWTQLNHTMRLAMVLAVGSGMEWEASDLTHIDSKFRPSYWLGERGWEWVYSLAIAVGNTSFINAFEEYSGREPYLANDITLYNHSHGFVHVNSQTFKRGRVCLGCCVMIDGVQFGCTSINSERVVFTSRSGDKRTIRKITHDDCKQLWPAPKKPKKQESEKEAA